MGWGDLLFERDLGRPVDGEVDVLVVEVADDRGLVLQEGFPQVRFVGAVEDSVAGQVCDDGTGLGWGVADVAVEQAGPFVGRVDVLVGVLAGGGGLVTVCRPGRCGV